MPLDQQDPGIELLVALTRDGEIDPWDIDIIQVTDKYLAALDRMEDRTLAASAKCLFYACVLLHMKARILAAAYLPVAGVSGDDCACSDGPDDGDLPLSDAELGWASIVSTEGGVMLVPRGRLRKRPITLADLIHALKQCDTVEKRRREAGLPSTAYLMSITHQDDITGDVERVRRLLSRLSGSSRRVGFHQLVGYGFSAGGLFLALLFMAARNEVHLEQEEFYRDLSILACGEAL